MQKKIKLILLCISFYSSLSAFDLGLPFSWASNAGKKVFFLPIKFSVAAFTYMRKRFGYIARSDLASNLTAQQSFYTEKFAQVENNQKVCFDSLGGKVASQGNEIKKVHSNAESVYKKVQAVDEKVSIESKRLLEMFAKMRHEMQDHHRNFEFKTVEEINGFATALELQRAELEKQCAQITVQLKKQNVSFQKEIDGSNSEIAHKFDAFNKEMDAQLISLQSKVDQMRASQEKIQVRLNDISIQGHNSQQEIESLRKKLAIAEKKVNTLETTIEHLLEESQKKTQAVQFLTKEVDSCNEMLNHLEKKFNDSKAPSFQRLGQLIKKAQNNSGKNGASVSVIVSMENLKADLFNKPSHAHGNLGTNPLMLEWKDK